MTRNEIIDGIRTVIADRLGLDAPVEPHTDLLRDLRLDSIQQFSLVVELENHFEVCFEPGDEAGLTTIDQVADLVQQRLTPPSPQPEQP